MASNLPLQTIPPEVFPQWPLLEGIIVFTLASTSLYTLNVVLALNCIREFIVQNRRFKSNRRLTISCAYVFALVAIASEAAVHFNMNTINTIKQLVLTSSPYIPNFPLYPLSLPLAIWGADGILIWRCLILYQPVSRPKKVLVYLVLVSLGFISLGVGIFNLWANIAFPTDNSGDPVMIIGSPENLASDVLLLPVVTAVTNGVLALLIATRLLHAHFVLSSVQSDGSNQRRSGPYLTAIAICVESSTIIVVVAILTVICEFFPVHYFSGLRNSWFQPEILLTQLCVLSPLLIIYRVSRNRADEIITRLEETLAFHHTQDSALSQSVIDRV